MKRMGMFASGLLLFTAGAWVVAQEDLPQSVPPSGATVADQYSYGIGLKIGSDFRNSQVAISIEQFAAGLRDGLSGAQPKFDQATLAKAMQQFETEMMKKQMSMQEKEVAANRKIGEEFLAKNAKAEGVQVTKSGLQYKVIKSGTGATPTPEDQVKCNYKGTLVNGKVFDASAKHGGPATFPVGGVIKGWTEALQLMKVGDKWELYIPADLAYGNQSMGPDLPGGSTLIFEIELLDIL